MRGVVGIRMRAAVIGSAMLVLGAFGFVSAGAQTGPFCYVASLPATIVGTDGADHLVGTYGADVVVAGGGNDRIVVGRGKDVVCAGSGDDRVEAGTGRDYVLAEAGRDRVNLGRRADASADYYILGGASGGPGDDRLWGGQGSDSLSGGAGDDVIRGGRGNELGGSGFYARISGDAGDDRLFGGVRGDEMTGGAGDDLLSGGPGRDGWSNEAYANTPFWGGGGNDLVVAGAGADRLYCEPGADRVYGGGGGDDFCGPKDEDRDLLNGGDGEDGIVYRKIAGRTLVVSLDGARNDGPGCPAACVPDNVHNTIEAITVFTKGRNTLVGNARANRITIRTPHHRPIDGTVNGMSGNDILDTGAGGDSIWGGGGEDLIRSRGGDDSLNGGPRDDRCDAGPGTDTALNCERVRGVP